MPSRLSRTGAFFLGGVLCAILSRAEGSGAQVGRQVWVKPGVTRPEGTWGSPGVSSQLNHSGPPPPGLVASPLCPQASLVRDGACGREAALCPPTLVLAQDARPTGHWQDTAS